MTNNTTNCTHTAGHASSRVAALIVRTTVRAAVAALAVLGAGVIATRKLRGLEERVTRVEDGVRALQGIDALHADECERYGRTPEPGHSARRSQ